MVIEKLDLTLTDHTYYKISKTPEFRDLDAYYYLTVAGQCAPEDPAFLHAIEQLYAVSYGIKFLTKAEDMDFTVPKMEGIWWIEGGMEKQSDFPITPREKWCWKIAIRMPDFVEEQHFFRALENARKKKQIADIEAVKFELINEGRVAQVLHIGSYDEEEATIARLHQFITENGLKISGYHHEIYLSDPRRTASEKLRTIIRYPVSS